MAEETCIGVSGESIRRILKAHDIVLSRPQHTISSPDPEYKVKNNEQTLIAIWSPKGQQTMIPKPGQTEKHYGIGTVNYHYFLRIV